MLEKTLAEKVQVAAYTHTFYSPLDIVQDYPGQPVPEPIGFYSSKRQRVAVASAGPYANLHIASDR